jgi:hypothetical protein
MGYDHAHPPIGPSWLAWYEIDMNWYGISVLRMVGLAREVKAQKLGLDRSDESRKAVAPPTVAAAMPNRMKYCVQHRKEEGNAEDNRKEAEFWINPVTTLPI